jgi:2-C-methyl-D-erythritol 4-phosphate cytidylyltransferase
MNEVEPSFRSKVVGVVLAGGSGSRFGAGLPKQLIRLAGHAILYHSLRALDASSAFDELIVVGNPDFQSEIEDIVADAVRKTPWQLVEGGAQRNLSIKNAVAHLQSDEDLILVHDGVRPLVSAELVQRVIAALSEFDAVMPVIDSVDPIVEVASDRVVAFKDRDSHLRGQTPQGFRAGALRSAFQNSSPQDQASYSTVFELILATQSQIRVGTVTGELNNIKVTLPVDHMVAGQLLLERI